MVDEPNTIPVANTKHPATQSTITIQEAPKTLTTPATPKKPTATSAKPINPTINEPKKSIFKKWWLWAIVGAAILILIFGILFAVLDNPFSKNDSSNKSTIDNQSGSPAQQNQDLNNNQATNESIGPDTFTCDEIAQFAKEEIAQSCDNSSLTNIINNLDTAGQLGCENAAKEIFIYLNETCGEEAVAIMLDLTINSMSNEMISSTGCFDATASLAIASGEYTFTDPATNTASIQVQRSAGDYNLIGLEIMFAKEGNTILKEWTGELPFANGMAIHVFTGADFDYGTADEVAVAAIIQEGNTKKTCESSAMIPISAL